MAGTVETASATSRRRIDWHGVAIVFAVILAALSLVEAIGRISTMRELASYAREHPLFFAIGGWSAFYLLYAAVMACQSKRPVLSLTLVTVILGALHGATLISRALPKQVDQMDRIATMPAISATAAHPTESASAKAQGVGKDELFRALHFLRDRFSILRSVYVEHHAHGAGGTQVNARNLVLTIDSKVVGGVSITVIDYESEERANKIIGAFKPIRNPDLRALKDVMDKMRAAGDFDSFEVERILFDDQLARDWSDLNGLLFQRGRYVFRSGSVFKSETPQDLAAVVSEGLVLDSHIGTFSPGLERVRERLQVTWQEWRSNTSREGQERWTPFGKWKLNAAAFCLLYVGEYAKFLQELSTVLKTWTP